MASPAQCRPWGTVGLITHAHGPGVTPWHQMLRTRVPRLAQRKLRPTLKLFPDTRSGLTLAAPGSVGDLPARAGEPPRH